MSNSSLILYNIVNLINLIFYFKFLIVLFFFNIIFYIIYKISKSYLCKKCNHITSFLDSILLISSSLGISSLLKSSYICLLLKTSSIFSFLSLSVAFKLYYPASTTNLSKIIFPLALFKISSSILIN
jgi:hypothetical protein